MSGVMMGAIGKGDPAFVSYDVGGGTGGSPSLIIDDPTDAISSDLHIAFYGMNHASGLTWTPASGFTERLDQSARPSIGVASATGGTLGLKTWTASSSPTKGLAGIRMRFRTSTYDTIGSVATTTSNGTLTIPGITASRGIVLACVFIDNSAGIGAPGTTTAPSGFSTIYNDTLPSSYNYMRVAVFSKSVSAGATGGIDTTIASIGGTAAGVLIGLI